jgi:hypothetical protein
MFNQKNSSMPCIGVNPISLPLDGPVPSLLSGGGLGWGCFIGKIPRSSAVGSSFKHIRFHSGKIIIGSRGCDGVKAAKLQKCDLSGESSI